MFHEAFLSSSHCLSEGRAHDVLEHTTKPKGVLNSQFFYIGFPWAEMTEKCPPHLDKQSVSLKSPGGDGVVIKSNLTDIVSFIC